MPNIAEDTKRGGEMKPSEMARIGDQRRLVNDNKTVKEIMKATERIRM